MVKLARREPESLYTFAVATRTASAATARSTTDESVVTALNPADESGQACAYKGSTSVPKQVGGILFATLSRIFCGERQQSKATN